MDTAIDPRDSSGERLPSLRDGWMRALLAFTFVMQLFVWARISGYSVADAVEFMERAQILVHAERTVDEGVIRPFGFSSVLLPFFVVADWLGVQDPRSIAWCISLLQIALALCLVFYSARVAAQLAGRRAGLVGGLIVGANPVFLQYSTQPVSDIAAALFIALALEAVLEPVAFRRGLRSGLWLAAALLMAYKSLLVIFLVLLVVYVRDGRRRRPFAVGITTGVACGIVAQALLDRWMFGSFGVGFVNYVVQNVLSVPVSIALKLNWLWLAEPLYRARQNLMGNGYMLAEDLSTRGLQESWFYFWNLPQMLAWPVIGLVTVGIWSTIARPSWKRWLLLLVLVASIAIMSNKGSKDFRLWLQLMPSIAAVCACGWAYLFERDSKRASDEPALDRKRALRGTIAALVALSIVVLDIGIVRSLELKHFGGYWRAMEWINGRARETYPARAERALAYVRPLSPPPRINVASGYNWAVYMRQSPLVELHKLPWQLNFWNRYDSAQKVADMEALEEMDKFIVHLPTLTENPDLFEWVNAHFEVEACFYDQVTFDPGLGPVFVLGRRTGSADALTFFDLHPVQSIESFRASRELPQPSEFVDAADTEHARLVFLGYEYRELAGDHHGWITYYWSTPTGLEGNFDFIDRVTSPDESNPWQNNHSPAYGLYPTSSWKPGEIVSEGYPLVACAEPFKRGGRVRHLGGAYRRGDLIPVRLWMAIVEYDPVEMHEGKLVEHGHLVPARIGDVRADGAAATRASSGDDPQFSMDGLVRVGRFMLPVNPAARVPDDGRPIPQ
jgi:hypothetical protein